VTDAQFITFILGFAATIAAILIALLINNARLNDAKEALRAEIKAGDAGILAQMATYQMDIISKIAELDNRITRLER
jgi:hypothetical protein